MASIQKEFAIASSAHDVWDAVRDFGAVHTRLAPGFVTDAVMDGNSRLVTFSNGTSAGAILVDCDDAKRRLVYAIVSERIRQHSASVQIYEDGDRRSKFVWTVDVLPNEIAPYISGQMDLSIAAMKKRLEERLFIRPDVSPTTMPTLFMMIMLHSPSAARSNSHRQL
ncbi:SRPBCC family protein [Streptomyces griseus]